MPPAAQPAGNDKTTLWGVLGIVFGFCCWPLGIVFAILAMNEAKKAGKKPTLAYVAFAIAAISLVISIISIATGALSGMSGTQQ
ncbi:DUF4190 domain-containing protein [Planosporangium flavigriseum]|nr:DUF4190 domain-containing protein [Planosporangium flavigriseum]NJC64842.1 DUF4190 domain-containing protein [Planosporangium flavigriseum]